MMPLANEISPSAAAESVHGSFIDAHGSKYERSDFEAAHFSRVELIFIAGEV